MFNCIGRLFLFQSGLVASPVHGEAHVQEFMGGRTYDTAHSPVLVSWIKGKGEAQPVPLRQRKGAAAIRHPFGRVQQADIKAFHRYRPANVTRKCRMMRSNQISGEHGCRFAVESRSAEPGGWVNPHQYSGFLQGHGRLL